MSAVVALSFPPMPRREEGPRAVTSPSALLAATSCSVIVTDATLPDNPIVYANAAFSKLCGYPEADIIGRNCRFLQGPDTDPAACAEVAAAIADGRSIQREILNYRKDGTPFWNSLTIDPIHDATGVLVGFVSTQRDADAVHLARKAQAEAELRLASIADHIPGFIYRRVMRTDGAIQLAYASPSLARMLGLNETDARRSFYECVHKDDRDALIAAIRKSAADMSLFRGEFRLVSADGSVHWVRSDAPPWRMANGEIVWDGMAIEISTEKRWQNEIADLALRDPLTRLLTRDAWRKAVDMRLDDRSTEGRQIGLIYVDIAAFGELNARLGSRAGDDILRETGERLARIAEAVTGFAARLGGDEFALLATGCADERELMRLAHSLGEELAHPMMQGGQRVTIGTHIGASLHAQATGPDCRRTNLAAELNNQAELALRWAKRSGRKEVVVYSAEQDDRFRNMAVLGLSLERAIADNELQLQFQPIVELATGRIVSTEALVRWNHPTLGMQRPELFVPLAEKTGLIVPLGRWVIERAIGQCRQWLDAGLPLPRIAVNVSGAQLLAPGFVDHVRETLKALSVPGRYLEFELTETQLIEASPPVLASLRALRELDIAIAIDDFGSGNATFRYLHAFPVDKVKIDQLFVRKLVIGSNDELIIRALLSLARGLGIALVAEGIETEMQRDFLAREGCKIGQGYLFSRPLADEDFAWMVANDVRLPLAGLPAENPLHPR